MEDPAKREAYLKKERERKKKRATPSNEIVPYQRPQSLGKAVRRLELQLPSSPWKVKAVISGLAESV